MRRMLALLLISAGCAVAADYSGTYKAEVETSSGKVENTLVIRTEGKSLTGTITNQLGKFPLQNGDVEGTDVFFNVVVKSDGDDVKMTYRGHVFGDEITFKIEVGERIIEMVAKKIPAT
jgi:hypothetical protein